MAVAGGPLVQRVSSAITPSRPGPLGPTKATRSLRSGKVSEMSDPSRLVQAQGRHLAGLAMVKWAPTSSVRGERPSAERFEHGLALGFLSTIKRNERLSARKFNCFAPEHSGGGLGNYETTARPTETMGNALFVADPRVAASIERVASKAAALLAARLDTIGSYLPALCPGQFFAPVPVLATATP